MKWKTTVRIAILILAAAAAFPQTHLYTQASQKEAPGGKKKREPSSTPTIWRDPGAVERLDFVGGPGYTANAPKPPFQFVEEDTDGTNPKIKIKDATGRNWGVKWGSEVHAEVFASRIAWAAGYWVEPCYFISRGRVEGVTGLKRARKFVESDGSFENARFELKDKGWSKQVGTESWRWDTNPFTGTKELKGLKIIIMLTSNWDPKDGSHESSNTAIHINKKTGETRYVFGDWGATMGKWGGYLTREKWDCDGYTSQTKKFVTEVEGDQVHFGYDGKESSEMRQGITVNDVAWIVRYVGRITDAQLRSGLRASGAERDEIECFASAIRRRIDMLKRVARGEQFKA